MAHHEHRQTPHSQEVSGYGDAPTSLWSAHDTTSPERAAFTISAIPLNPTGAAAAGLVQSNAWLIRKLEGPFASQVATESLPVFAVGGEPIGDRDTADSVLVGDDNDDLSPPLLHAFAVHGDSGRQGDDSLTCWARNPSGFFEVSDVVKDCLRADAKPFCCGRGVQSDALAVDKGVAVEECEKAEHVFVSEASAEFAMVDSFTDLAPLAVPGRRRCEHTTSKYSEQVCDAEHSPKHRNTLLRPGRLLQIRESGRTCSAALKLAEGGGI